MANTTKRMLSMSLKKLLSKTTLDNIRNVFLVKG